VRLNTAFVSSFTSSRKWNLSNENTIL